MPHIKIDTAFYRHPKALKLTAAQREAFLRCLCWAGESDSPHGHEGHLTKEVLREIHVTGPAVSRLVQVGLLHPNGDGYLIHDWRDWQEGLIDSREQRREQARLRKQRERDRRRDADA